jgi:hypothetical protein
MIINKKRFASLLAKKIPQLYGLENDIVRWLDSSVLIPTADLFKDIYWEWKNTQEEFEALGETQAMWYDIYTLPHPVDCEWRKQWESNEIYRSKWNGIK